MAEIRIDANTTLQQLQKFTEQVGGQTKLRGKQNEDGSVTLYTSTKRDWGIKEFFTGHVTRRQEGARQALDRLVARLEGDPRIGEGARQVLSNMRNALPQGGGEVRGSQFRQILHEAIHARNEGLSFQNKIAEGIKTGDQAILEECGEILSGQIARMVRDKPIEDQIRFAASDGKEYMGNIALLMSRHVDDKNVIGVDYDNCSPEARKFLDTVYHDAMTQLNDRVLDEETIQVGGTTYKKQCELDRGAFGAVDLYENKDEGKSLVIKRPLLEEGQSMGDKFKEASDEALMHLKAQGAGSENVIGLKSAMRTQDGGLVIALEKAPFGNTYQLTQALNEGLKEGLIPKEVAMRAQAAILMDMLKGLQHMHEQGMTHQDVKPPNYLLGENGKAKLSDFGLSVGTSNVESKNRLVDNPMWLAPEVMSGHSELTSHTNVVSRMLKNVTPIEVMREQFKGQIPDDELERLLENVRQDREKRIDNVRENNPVKVTQGVDTWAIGVSGYQMFEGADPFGYQKFNNQIEKNYVEFAKNEDNRVYPGDKLTAHQELINGLMHPNPQERWSPQEALESEVFKGVEDDVKIRDFLANSIFREVYKQLSGNQPITDEMKEKLRGLSQRAQ
ncbi:MAG TPA: protein kinase [Usitatibacter sp.]|nr:protein kinase [Usitatibacter sp.]